MSSIRKSRFDASAKLGVVAILALAFFLCANYFFSFPISEFVLKIQSLFISSLVFFFCYFLGKSIGKKVGEPKYSSDLFRFISRMAVGIGGLGLLMVLLGWALPGPLIIKIFLLFIFLLVISIRPLGEIYHQNQGFSAFFVKLETKNFSIVDAVLLVGSFAGIGISFTACFSPITYYDSLVYHLALPQTYLKWGKIATVPYNLYSYFPANIEMIFLFVMGLIKIPDYSVNLIGWGISLLCSLLIFDFVKEKAFFRVALFAVLLWWTAPVVLFLSLGAYVDVPLAFFTFIAIRFFYQYLEERDLHSLLYSAFFCGVSTSIKYTGAISGIIFSFYLFALLLRKKESFRNFLVFFGVFLIPILPWLVKNFLSCGNPVFPFFYRVLGHPQSWEPESAQKYFSILTEYGIRNNFLSDLFFLTWDISTNPKIFGGGIDVLGLFGWPLIFILSLTGCFFILKDYFRSEKSSVNKNYLLVFYLIVHFLFWFYSKPVLRFLVPLLPIFIVIGCIGINKINYSIRKVVVFLISVPWLLGNFFIFFFISQQLRPFSVALGIETYQEFLSKRFEYYPVFQYINNNLDVIDRVIIIGEQRSYGLNANFSSLNTTSTSAFAKLCNESKDIFAVLEDLFNSGSFYLLISEKELNRLGGLSQLGFSEEGISRFNSMLKEYYAPIYSFGGVTLYKQKPPLKIESK